MADEVNNAAVTTGPEAGAGASVAAGAETGSGEPGAEGAQTSEAEFTDAGEAGADAGTEGENRDAGEAAKAPTERPKQTREQNAEFARRRREQAQHAAVEKARTEAVIDALGGVNPYTSEEMKDADDVAEYLRMKRIEKSGGDPIYDYRKTLKQEAAEKAREAAERADRERRFNEDMEAFKAEFPDVDPVELLSKDEDFRDYADGKLGSKPLWEIYPRYNEGPKKAQDAANKKAAQAVANNQASPGSLSAPGGEQT